MTRRTTETQMIHDAATEDGADAFWAEADATLTDCLGEINRVAAAHAEAETAKANFAASLAAGNAELERLMGLGAFSAPLPVKRTRLMGGEDRPALLEQVIQYNKLADQARGMKIKGLGAKRLGRQASPTFRSLEIGEGWIAAIAAEIVNAGGVVA